MTRKDFELIADVIAKMPSFAPNLRAAKASAASAFADRLKLVNPLFDRARFMEACGVTE